MTEVMPATRDQGTVVPGEVIQPTTYTGPKAVATHKLGEMLKELVHGSPHAFTSENDMLAALKTVDSYVKAHTQATERQALSDGTQRAPVEDVSERIPPVVGYAVPNSAATQPIDYDRLAAAIVRAQAGAAQAQAETNAQSPPVTAAEESA